MRIPFTNINTKEHYTQIYLYLAGMCLRSIIFWPIDLIRGKTDPPKPYQLNKSLTPTPIDPRNIRPKIRFRK